MFVGPMTRAKKICAHPRKAGSTRRIEGTQPPRHPPLWDRIAEFVDFSLDRGPIPKWMPQWIAQKDREVRKAEVHSNTEVLRKLEDGGTFKRIEREGGIPFRGLPGGTSR